MPHFAWAKIFCDLLRHPLLRDRPDSDVRLVIGLILEAKEHSDDGVIRNLTPASARGLCHIKATTATVKAKVDSGKAVGQWTMPADARDDAKFGPRRGRRACRSLLPGPVPARPR